MRGLLVWIVILTAVFFAVGETAGWYLGVPGQTPVFVYKRTATGSAQRQTINTDTLPVRLSGKVRHGSLEVTITYQRPESFQDNTPAGSVQKLFDRTYHTGDVVAIDQKFNGGVGDYVVKLQFDDATGLFRLHVPNQNQL